MPEEKTPQVNNTSIQSSIQSQGVATAASASQAPQDVTAAVNSEQKPNPQNPFLIDIPAIPTQEGPMGIRFDFNDGARVLLPKGKWHVQIEDDETDNIIFACDAEGNAERKPRF